MIKGNALSFHLNFSFLFRLFSTAKRFHKSRRNTLNDRNGMHAEMILALLLYRMENKTGNIVGQKAEHTKRSVHNCNHLMSFYLVFILCYCSVHNTLLASIGET